MNVDPEPTKASDMRSCPGRRGGRTAHASTRAASVTVSPRSSKNATMGRVITSNHLESGEGGRGAPLSIVSSLTGAASSRARSGLPIEPRYATRNAGEDFPGDRVGVCRDLVRVHYGCAGTPLLAAEKD